MPLTPVEVRHVKLARGLLGYRRSATDRLLEEVAESFGDVWRDRADLAERVEQLEAELVRYRELETLLRTTLVSAERAAGELKEQAKREADLIVAEAQAEGRAITRRARSERDRLDAEARRLRALLGAALAAVEEEPADDEPAEDPVGREAAAACRSVHGRRRATSASAPGARLAGPILRTWTLRRPAFACASRRERAGQAWSVATERHGRFA
jgi:cell division initiation protein